MLVADVQQSESVICIHIPILSFFFFSDSFFQIGHYRVLSRASYTMGFPGGSDGKESACSAGDWGSIPGSGRSPGGGNGNPLQCSCLENTVGGGA